MAKLRVCKRDGETAEGKTEQRFRRFTDVFDVSGFNCSRLWPPEPSAFLWPAWAGWLGVRPASLCHVYFQSLARLVSRSDKRQTSCPQWRGMRRCVEGKSGNAGGQIFVALLHPVWIPPLHSTVCRPPSRKACSWHSVTSGLGGESAANCASRGQLSVQWEGGVCGRGSYLHSPSAPPHRHTVSEVSDEMKSLIIEKNKMALEEEPELLVKGEQINTSLPAFTQEWPQLVHWFGFCNVSLKQTAFWTHHLDRFETFWMFHGSNL